MDLWHSVIMEITDLKTGTSFKTIVPTNATTRQLKKSSVTINLYKK